MCCKLQVLKLVDATLWRVIIKKRKGTHEACLMAGRGGVLGANSGLTGHKSIDLLKLKARRFLIVKLLPRVTARGTIYVHGVGTDDREERWETTGAQLEALEEIAALTR